MKLGELHYEAELMTSGLRMPAEWSTHASCFVSWPCKESTWHGHIDKSKAAYARVIRAIGRFEPVTVLADPSVVSEPHHVLGDDFKVLEMPLDDSWIRDNGPIFVKDEDGLVSAVKFRFNAWGGKYPPYDRDASAPLRIARHLGMRCHDAPMVLEGGSISIDGEGTLLTTEQCLLNKNRNPQLSRDQIEQKLGELLGVEKVIWLAEGVKDDITDGHVDGVATFAGPHLIVASCTRDQTNPNFPNLQENLERLESATDAKGRSIEVIRIVQPRPREVDGIHITPGYTNHYIANGGVVMPTYGIAEDRTAIDVLRRAYPGRVVVGVECSYIEIGGGAVHCITQQLPAGPPASPR